MKPNHPFFSDQPEQDLAKHLPRSKRSQMGQVFTPYAIATDMAKWVTALKPPKSIMDPAFGLGVFLRAFLENSTESAPEMTGYEIDREIADQARDLFTGFGYGQIEIKVSNFLTSSWEPRFDAILSNPPYRRFRGLPGRGEYSKQAKENTGIKVSRSANLYTFFLIKAIHQLADGGRAGFILPYEFLSADYGQPVKQYLLDLGVLRKILILGEGVRPFDQVITTSCILCLERTPPLQPPVIQLCTTLNELSAALAETPDNLDVNPSSIQVPVAEKKWSITKLIAITDGSAKLVPLSTFGRITRGIATGDNGYFLLPESQRQHWELDQSSLFGCLAKSSLAPDHVFSTPRFEQLIKMDKPVWLFHGEGNEQLAAVKKYLAHGIEGGTNQRYLTRMRTPWYKLEDRPPAPLLATTFSRSGIRWVRNEANVLFLTTFHGFYPHPETNLELLSAYLITPLAQRILSQNQREYGNGLHKFEPNDLNQGLVVDIFQIPGNLQHEIIELYSQILKNYHDKNMYATWVTKLDRIFTEFFNSS